MSKTDKVNYFKTCYKYEKQSKYNINKELNSGEDRLNYDHLRS